MKLNCNCCDGIYNSLDIHFTSACDNKCAHCVDTCYQGLGISRPNVEAIVKTVVEKQDGIDDVLFLGGEPCLYLDELLGAVKKIKQKTNLKVFVTTSVPKICHDKKETFYELIDLLDGLNLSTQHYNEAKADSIRRTHSKYNRQAFYDSLPNKHKIRINLNIVKPFLYEKEDIEKCLVHYDKMGFNSIKISEIQHGEDVFVSFADVFGLKMKSPYSNGCQSYLNMDEIIKGFSTPVLLKRSCFLCEESLSASISDGIKVLTRLFKPSKNNYGVVYGDGTLTNGWV